MKNEIAKVIGILSILTVLSSIGYHYVLSLGNVPLSVIYLALFYMPTPLYSLIILSLWKKENIVLRYINIKNLNTKSIVFPIILFISWVFVTIFLSLILNTIFPDSFAKLATSNEQIIATISNLAGNSASNNINLPPSPLLFIPIGIFSSIIAGFSANLLFSLGEEVLWRGYLWEKFKSYGITNASIIIGSLWGIWHAPIIYRGYNYGTANSFSGVIMFILFCICFSFLFSTIMQKTESTLMVGALHGMFNAFAGIFVLLLVNLNPFIDGAIGIVSIFSMVIIFVIFNQIGSRKNLK